MGSREARASLRTRRRATFAVMSMGLGIGATASMFSLTRAGLKDLPFPEPDRVTAAMVTPNTFPMLGRAIRVDGVARTKVARLPYVQDSDSRIWAGSEAPVCYQKSGGQLGGRRRIG